VIAVVVVVILALAASMFGLWELQVPGWAMRASGGKSGYLGALLMGLMVGFVAAPCIGPFVLSLLTYVGQVGSPVLGFVLFFTLAMGLGLPYLILGTFTGLLNRMPASGAWMIGVRKVFGVLLVALAVHFAKPLLPAGLAEALMGAILILGGVYLLLIERPGVEQATVDRVMRVVSVAIIAAGVLTI
jgi:thiol:disulfide interchange protein DsbD